MSRVRLAFSRAILGESVAVLLPGVPDVAG